MATKKKRLFTMVFSVLVLTLFFASSAIAEEASEATAVAKKPEVLVWDHVFKANPDLTTNPPASCVTVLSPTWFSLTSSDGTVASKADLAYVAEAHRRGVRVEPLFDNGFNWQRTQAFLADPQARGRSIASIVEFCQRYQLDGINIDFENVRQQDRDALTNYVFELTEALHGIGMRVTMDVTVLSKSSYWSLCYDRELLSRIVDAVAVMTYDEHHASDGVSGSVASIGWVRQSIAKLLDQMPPSKILLGVPLYTREWEETPVKGGVKVRSRALSMTTAMEKLRANNARIIWDDKAGQYYGEYTKDGKRYRIWLEDQRSLSLKTALVKEFGLAGVAAWQRGFDLPEAWIAIGSTLD